ncbi:ABC transporter permease [Spiroplasma turonicum]|uniref:Uncharacterized protein n=1 Tax=Spiroplasma turonicum TaxID=216946 RepID=A0A0K1P5C0_9MOLU|nr:ABC transporter permease [Spiroplasma turonicum]AKU79491.1 hypothetical protein STURON_00245 [Spiroplasma turonicum]ALX70512.1 hypothetical protein STURO_v1c02440 [Spiroplasma turonicum]
MKYNGRKLFKLIFSIQFSNYKSDIFIIFSGWFITIVTMVVWLAFKNAGENIVYDSFILASAIGIGTIRNCLFNFIKTIHDFKQNNFFHRMFSTSLSKTLVFTTMILFNQIVNLFVTGSLIAIAMAFEDQRYLIKHVNWLAFFAGFFLLVFLSNIMAFIVALSCKKIEIAYVIGNIYYFGPVYLLGLGIPYRTLEKSQIVIIISFLFPQRYMLNIMASGWIDDPKMTDNTFSYGGNYWIPYLVSILLILISLIFVIKIFRSLFEDDNKKYKRYSNTKKHLGIIYAIKRASSFDELDQIIELRNMLNKNTEHKLKEKGRMSWKRTKK